MIGAATNAPAWASVGGVPAQAVGASFWTMTTSRPMGRGRTAAAGDVRDRGDEDRRDPPPTCKRHAAAAAGTDSPPPNVMASTIPGVRPRWIACRHVRQHVRPLASRPLFRHAHARGSGTSVGVGRPRSEGASADLVDRSRGLLPTWTREPPSTRRRPLRRALRNGRSAFLLEGRGTGGHHDRPPRQNDSARDHEVHHESVVKKRVGDDAVSDAERQATRFAAGRQR
jgi:hypothetical protein